MYCCGFRVEQNALTSRIGGRIVFVSMLWLVVELDMKCFDHHEELRVFCLVLGPDISKTPSPILLLLTKGLEWNDFQQWLACETNFPITIKSKPQKASDLPHLVSRSIVDIYADDTTLSTSATVSDIPAIQQQLQDDINKIADWISE